MVARLLHAIPRLLAICTIMAAVLVSGCTSNQGGGNGGADKVTSVFASKSPPVNSSMESFSITYPNWPEAGVEEPEAVVALVRQDKVCSFRLNEIEAPPEWYEKAIKDHLASRKGTIQTEGPPITYRLPTPDGKYTFLAKTSGMLCDDKSYFAVFSCLEDRFDEAGAQDVFDSMRCERGWTVPARKNRQLAMVVSPAGSKPEFVEYMSAYNIVRNSGVQLVHNTVAWGDVEAETGVYDWTVRDFKMNMLRSKGLKTTVGFRAIHTSVVGDLPAGFEFKGFDDPAFVSGYTDFVLDFIDRYQDVISYVMIGNEVDIYLHAKPDELESYASFYRQVYDAIKQRYPNLPVGTIFAYHEIRNNKEQRIYERLAFGDFDAFTLYIYSQGFIFDRDPQEMMTYLREIEDMTGDRDFAITEFGWNTHGGLEGKESDQVEAVKVFFDFLEGAPERLRFMSYFTLHDWTKETCLKGGETFFEPDDPWLENEGFMDVFSDFLCYLGMIRNDGTPKQAWDEFSSRGQAYAKAGP